MSFSGGDAIPGSIKMFMQKSPAKTGLSENIHKIPIKSHSDAFDNFEHPLLVEYS